jgi:hypothetical protein
VFAFDVVIQVATLSVIANNTAAGLTSTNVNALLPAFRAFSVTQVCMCVCVCVCVYVCVRAATLFPASSCMRRTYRPTRPC